MSDFGAAYLDLRFRDVKQNVIQTLQSRAKIVSNAVSQDVLAQGKSAIIKDGITMSITGSPGDTGRGKVMTIQAMSDEQMSKIYQQTFLPPPILKRVNITSGGTYGATWTLEAEIHCFNLSDFNEVEANFLLPGKEISFRGGYGLSWRPGATGKNIELGKKSKYRVVRFGFNYSGNRWVCTFTAIGPIDIFAQSAIPFTLPAGRGGKMMIGNTEVDVQGILQFMYLVDVQIDQTKGNNAVMNVCVDSDVLILDTDMWFRELTTEGTQGTQSSLASPHSSVLRLEGDHGKRVFFTLGYVINRICKELIAENVKESAGIFPEGLRIDFDKWMKNLKFDNSQNSFLPAKLAFEAASADPSTVLIFGPETKYGPLDFGREVVGAARAREGSQITKLENIYVHGGVIAAAYEKAVVNMDQVDTDPFQAIAGSSMIRLLTFLEYIFSAVRTATGGTIYPCLVQNEDEEEYPVILNRGIGADRMFTGVRFDPINGDGSTRDLQIQSSAGSQTAQIGIMQQGMSGASDLAAYIKGDMEKANTKRVEQQKQALQAYKNAIQTVGDTKCAQEAATEAVARYGQLAKLRPIDLTDGLIRLYPGLAMSVRLDGIWGFLFGNYITSTSVPSAYKKTGFLTTKVSHSISADNNDWETTLDGILAVGRVEYANISEQNAR